MKYRRSENTGNSGPRSAICNSRSGGFTLIELIVAITILTLVTVIIGHGFRLGMDAWEKGENETGWTQRFRILSGLLAQEIRSAYPYRIDVDNEKVVVFKGEPDSILFVTTTADSSFGGFKWVRYSHKDGALLLKEGMLPDKKLMENLSGKEETVDKDIEEIRFEYLSNDKGEWSDSWDLSDKLPAAVKIKISYFQPFLISIPMGLIKKEEGNENQIL